MGKIKIFTNDTSLRGVKRRGNLANNAFIKKKIKHYFRDCFIIPLHYILRNEVSKEISPYLFHGTVLVALP